MIELSFHSCTLAAYRITFVLFCWFPSRNIPLVKLCFVWPMNHNGSTARALRLLGVSLWSAYFALSFNSLTDLACLSVAREDTQARLKLLTRRWGWRPGSRTIFV